MTRGNQYNGRNMKNLKWLYITTAIAISVFVYGLCYSTTSVIGDSGFYRDWNGIKQSFPADNIYFGNNSTITTNGLSSNAQYLTNVITKKIVVLPIKIVTSLPNNITDDCYTVLINDGAGDVNLPSAVGRTGRVFVIKNMTVNAVTVRMYGAETLDSDTQHILTPQYHSITVQSNGSNWFIIYHTP